MKLQQHFKLMATYNEWMNAQVYDTASKLSTTELAEERGAYFGSIFWHFKSYRGSRHALA